MSAPAQTSPVQIEFVAAAADLPAELWAKCFPPPLEGLFWYRALEESGLGDQFAFTYGVIRRGGIALGIAPCFVHDVPIDLVAPRVVAAGARLAAKIFPGAGIQRTFFIGSPCAEEGTVGLLPGEALADFASELAAAARAEAARRGAPMVVFKDFPATAGAELAALGRSAGFFSLASYPGTALDLPPPDADAYYRGLSSMRRHNLKKKLRRSAGDLALATTVVARPEGAALAEIHRLFLQTYERGKTKFERLGPAFFQAIARQEPARFILLRDAASGELVAFMLVFDLGRRVVNKFIGIDYGRAGGSAFLYFRLFEAALAFAYGRGARELQSGQTGYRAKLDVGHRLVPLFNLGRHRNPVVNALYGRIASRVSWKTLDSDLRDFLLAHPECDSPKL